MQNAAPALVDPVEAVVRPDAGADALFLAAQDLRHDVRVGHVGAGHADHVQLAFGDRVAGGRDVLDLGGVEGREVCRGADFAGEIQMRRAAHALHGDHVGQAGIGVDMPFHDVEEIDHAAGFQAARDFEPVFLREPAGKVFVAGVANADDELAADALADRRQRLEGKAKPVVEAAAIGAVEIVGQRRPELVHQMAVGLDLDAVEAGCLHPLGGRCVVLDEPCDIPVLDLFRKGLVRGLALMAGGDDRQPVGLVPARAAAEMGELDHHRAAMLVAFVGELPHPADDLVLPGEDVVEDRRAVARHRRRPRRHRQRHARPRPLRVIGAVALLRHPVLRIGGLVAGDHQPVLQRQVLERVGLQERIVRDIGDLPGSAGRIRRNVHYRQVYSHG